MTCGYYYGIYAAPDLGDNWIKNGHKFQDFTTPFSPVTLSLPSAAMPDVDISVKVNKTGRVVAESVEVTINADKKPQLVAKIQQWIDENHFDRALLYLETP